LRWRLTLNVRYQVVPGSNAVDAYKVFREMFIDVTPFFALWDYGCLRTFYASAIAVVNQPVHVQFSQGEA
jgi:hypothetical protein